MPDTSYYGQDELRGEVVLGESVENQVVMTDEYGNVIDLNSTYKLSIVDESGKVLSNDSLYWTTEEQNGHPVRINQRDWKPVNAGSYKVQLFPNVYSGGQYINGELLAERT